MLCEELMTRNPKCCAPSDSAVRAARMMKIEDVGSLPVCSSQESKRLVGIVTDRDLCLEIVAEGRDPNTVTVEAIMTREPVTCRTDEDLETALDRMEANQVRRIPVVDRNGMLAGIISQADIATRLGSPSRAAEVVEEISRPSGGNL
jgi:CBS domain-containing protein